MEDTKEKTQRKIRQLQLELGTIEILQALKAGIDEDLREIDEEMKDPDPKLRPHPETKKSLGVYELELQGVIERLDASEKGKACHDNRLQSIRPTRTQ